MPHADPARPLPPEPTTPGALHAWLREYLGLRLPRVPLLRGNQSPFEYLCFSFFGAPVGDSGEESSPDCVVWANRGGGKTFLGALATMLDLVYRPGIEVRILAGSLEQSKRMHAHLRGFFDPRENQALAETLRGSITERRIALTNGSVVELLAQSQTSVRGTRVQKLRCDEVDLFDPHVWEAAQLTTRSKVCGGRLVRGSVECLSTMHIPHGVMHGLVRECHEGVRHLFRWGVVDVLGACDDHRACGTPDVSPCPLLTECAGNAKLRTSTAGHISIEDAIAQKRRVPMAIWESEMLCLRPRRTDAVLPEFDPRVHVFAHEGPSAAAFWAVGMDFGIRAPTAIVYAAVGADGVVWIMDERVVADVVLDEHIRALSAGLAREGVAAWPAPAFIAPDPAGHQINSQTGISPIAVLHQRGFATRTSRQGIHAGLSLIRARLAPATGEPPRLFIHQRCRTLIECMERYHYSPDPTSDTPIKGEFDHAVDALRYLVVALDRPSVAATGDYLCVGRRPGTPSK